MDCLCLFQLQLDWARTRLKDWDAATAETEILKILPSSVIARGVCLSRNPKAESLVFVMARVLVSALVGVSAIVVGIASGVLVLLLAVSPVSAGRQIYVFPQVAAIIQIVSSLILLVLNFLHIRHNETLPKSKGRLLTLLLGIVLSVVSAAMVGASLGWAENSVVAKDKILGCTVSVFLRISFVVWAVSVLIHLVYFFTLAWVLKSATRTPPQRFSIDDTSAAPQEMVDTTPPASATTIQSNPFREHMASSTPQLTPSDSTGSMRSSFSTLQRPASSKRSLLPRHSLYKQQSRASSSDGLSRRPSQDEGFDSWDTSGVSSQIRETVLQTKPPLKGSGLEPIPGSRSPSPAKALEGPFFQTSPSLTPPDSPLPQPSVSLPNSPPASPIDHPLDRPNFPAMFPPPSPPPSSPPPTTPRQMNFSRPGSRSGPVSRSASVAIPRSRQGSRSRAPSEDHIHPLFRTSSPTPPPGASMNTTVTAAPEAGQLINEHMLKRMRSGSLPSISSPLIRSESSPDVRTIKVPPSPSLETMPTRFLVGSRPDRPHQRKRSASFQSSIDG